ncbi:MAG: NeuD/PglB/VioB family sugar acetyltransferase [Kiritimatiellae bacterium]|nr:NeuD/PglB/VioB family sugar acetyltransferase [Kiritimatiellia bacterium]MDD3545703.1 NeuD/PglB/VioB family sugar acetyltransferase [Kiritimatiellia bacterium]MDD4024531.1 NeuD/PglB/VioB family sugar acetyltransferase [Kiritimatiellia bacterium]
MKKIVIIGAGGFGAEAAWLIGRVNQRHPEFELLGFCDDAENKRSGVFRGFPLLGRFDEVGGCGGLDGFFCAIGNNEMRKKVFAQAAAMAVPPVTLVDPGAAVAPDVRLGAGCYIGIGSVVSCGAVLGDGVLVNHGVTVGHDAAVEAFAQLSPGARVSGGCFLGEGALMGSNACTIPGIRVGAWATVGAGAAAVRDLSERGSLVRLAR